jgi:hypothetical protein
MFYLPNRITKRDLIILFNKNIVRIEGGIIAMTIENNATCPESFGVINIIVMKIEILITNRYKKTVISMIDPFISRASPPPLIKYRMSLTLITVIDMLLKHERKP